MSSDVLRLGNYANFSDATQINTRNLDQTIRARVVVSSPLIRFLYGTAIAFDNFEAFLKEDAEGYVVNASENKTKKEEEKYKLLTKNVAPIGDFVRVYNDVIPPPILITNGAFSSTASLLNFQANAEYHALAGMKLLNQRTGEYIVINVNATSNTGISVTRGADTTTSQAVLDGDTWLVCGQHLDLLGPQVVTPSTLVKGRTERANGWARVMTMAMPISASFREEGVLYNGQFLELVDQDALKRHKQYVLNEILYADRGGVDKSKAPFGQFNGWTYWAKQNPSIYFALQDIGILTPTNFEALMTWFEPYEGIGDSDDNPMLYFCGTTAYKALQKYLKAGILLTAEDHFPSTTGSRVEKYITDTGKVVYICLDKYLDHIGRSGDIFMSAEDNVALIVGEDEFFTPESERLPILPGKARFIDYIPDYYARNNQRADAIVSQFSLQCAYPELLTVATGIKSPSA